MMQRQNDVIVPPLWEDKLSTIYNKSPTITLHKSSTLESRLHVLTQETHDIREGVYNMAGDQSVKFAVVGEKLDEIDAKLEELSHEMHSAKNGCLLWRVDNFNRRWLKAKSGLNEALFSPYIYSGPYGYKLQAVIYPDGISSGKGSFLSVYIVLHRGQYDDLLPWPFQQKINIKFLDLKNDKANASHIFESISGNKNSSSFVKPVKQTNPGWGFPKFLSHNELSLYLKDDSLYFLMDIQPMDVMDNLKEILNTK